MIMKKTRSVTKTHDIAILECEYKSHYPGSDFKLKHPFDFSSYEASEFNLGETELMQAHIAQFKPSYMDQHLRYPNNHNTGGFSYQLEKSYFEFIKNEIQRISSL